MGVSGCAYVDGWAGGQRSGDCLWLPGLYAERARSQASVLAVPAALLSLPTPALFCPHRPPNICSVTPVRDASGRLLSFIGVQSDITELVRRRHAEKELQVRGCVWVEAGGGAGSRMLIDIPECGGGMLKRVCR